MSLKNIETLILKKKNCTPCEYLTESINNLEDKTEFNSLNVREIYNDDLEILDLAELIEIKTFPMVIFYNKTENKIEGKIARSLESKNKIDAKCIIDFYNRKIKQLSMQLFFN